MSKIEEEDMSSLGTLPHFRIYKNMPVSLDNFCYDSVIVVLRWHFKDVTDTLRKMMACNGSELSECN